MQVKCLDNLGHFILYFVDIKLPIFQAQIFGMFSKSNFGQEKMATSVCNMRDMALFVESVGVKINGNHRNGST
jgi:hypothetical protein